MRLAPPFHDHAVLQRHCSIPVWGSATPGATVVVTVAGQRAETVTASTGQWLLRLAALPAGGPYELVAESGTERVVARDILVGEVWICAGQSNMEWKLNQCVEQNADVPSLPRIRLLTVATPAALGRQDAIDGRWTAADPASLAAFSAVGGWFGRRLHAELDVPIGLICIAWGGTRVQAWISREALAQDPSGQDELRRYEAYAFAPSRREADLFSSFEDWERRGAPQDTGISTEAAGFAKAEYADHGWRTMDLPSAWQHRGHEHSGIFWFRRTIQVPAAWVGKPLALHLGAIDKHDDTWVNGVRVGGIGREGGPLSWSTPREYIVPAGTVGADGRLVIAVRARSHVFHGGMIGPATAMQVFPVGSPDQTLPLSGDWRYSVEQDWGLVQPMASLHGAGNPNSPHILFDSRLAPLIPYAIAGTIWYQGESNESDPQHYRRLIVAMIRDWRRAFAQGDFPFIQVQLANFRTPLSKPSTSAWAVLREAQQQATAEPAVGYASAIDVGEEADIHPQDKRTVGERLARWALCQHYHRGGPKGGPEFLRVASEGERLRVHFTDAAGLTTRDGGPVKRLAVLGTSGPWRWAESRIDGETLVVWHPDILTPVAVRYAWEDNPAGCNLVNGADLPAGPFRTDQ
jgi:sialate O-acetylesterase